MLLIDAYAFLSDRYAARASSVSAEMGLPSRYPSLGSHVVAGSLLDVRTADSHRYAHYTCIYLSIYLYIHIYLSIYLYLFICIPSLGLCSMSGQLTRTGMHTILVYIYLSIHTYISIYPSIYIYVYVYRRWVFARCPDSWLARVCTLYGYLSIYTYIHTYLSIHLSISMYMYTVAGSLLDVQTADSHRYAHYTCIYLSIHTYISIYPSIYIYLHVYRRWIFARRADSRLAQVCTLYVYISMYLYIDKDKYR